jgi:hypothetical protein
MTFRVLMAHSIISVRLLIGNNSNPKRGVVIADDKVMTETMRSPNRMNNMNNLNIKNRMKSTKTRETMYLALEWE